MARHDDSPLTPGANNIFRRQYGFMPFIIGSLYPAFFRRIAGGLFIALLAVIVIQLVNMFIFHRSPTWIDWAVILIICGYAGYDWARAGNSQNSR